VTGTNGKSTVTSLIASILSSGGKRAVACGNIGTPLSQTVGNLKKGDIIVAEVSSFQLERQYMKESFPADVRVLLNITPDHLSRHKTFKRYAEIKKSIFLGMSKNHIGISGPTLRKRNVFLVGKDIKFSKNVVIYSEKLRKKFPSAKNFHLEPQKTKLVFEANKNNILAAVGAVLPFGLSAEEIRDAIYRFKPLPHRLEKIGELKGVDFINDSKATNVSSTVLALKSVKKPTVLILGGRDKGTSIIPILEHLENVKEIVAYGEAAERIYKNFRRKVPVTIRKKFFDALETAYQASVAGDVILLSPACASYDQFRNFEERGNAFKKWLKSIMTRKH
jgi:UDP-N-acetylmuramoylalanine--D-glutamate ligase